MNKKIHKPPSRQKYEAANPTVSIRVSHQLHQQLKMLRKWSGKSLGDILREALKAQGPSVKDAYLKGYNAAKDKYGVTFHCCICHANIIIEDPDTKKGVLKLMEENQWGHAECIKRRA